MGHGLDGVLLLVVIGAGTRGGPVDFAVRRPAPKGPGARCRSTLGWAQVRLAASIAALCRRGLERPAPLVVAESGCSASKLMPSVAPMHHGTMLVQGKTTYPLPLAEGHKGKGGDLVPPATWPWRQSRHAPGCR